MSWAAARYYPAWYAERDDAGWNIANHHGASTDQGTVVKSRPQALFA
jgi:hypothetical protein